MSAAKGKFDKAGLKEEANRVNSARTGITADMKKQTILMERSIVENSIIASLDLNSPLSKFVRRVFLEGYHDLICLVS